MPVKYSADPLPEDCEPLLFMSIFLNFSAAFLPAHQTPECLYVLLASQSSFLVVLVSPPSDEYMIGDAVPGVVNADEQQQQRRSSNAEQGLPRVRGSLE